MRLLYSSLRLCCIVLTAGLLLASTALAQTPARTVSDTVPLDADGEVTIDNHEGRITVTTWERAEVQYEVQIMPTDDDPDAEKTTIQVEQNGDRIAFSTEHSEGDDESKLFGFSFEDGWSWGGTNIPDVHYTITMPRAARLTIDDHESNMDVSGLQAALTIDTHEGPISITDQRGDVTIDSHESNMELRNITGFLEVDTHDGVLIVEDLCGGLMLDTHDGRAEVSIAELTDDITVDTHDGRITLHLATNAAFDLWTDFDDDTDLHSDFDLDAIRIADEDDDEVNYRGAINGGGPRIYLSSHDANFDLRTR